MINLLKGRITKLENQLKQKEEINEFLMPTLETNSASGTEKLLY